MSSFRESMIYLISMFGIMAALAIALALTKLFEMLPFIILAGAIGIGVIVLSVSAGTALVIRARRELPPIQPYITIEAPKQDKLMLQSAEKARLLK